MIDERDQTALDDQEDGGDQDDDPALFSVERVKISRRVRCLALIEAHILILGIRSVFERLTTTKEKRRR